jgi:hypothetical protein
MATRSTITMKLDNGKYRSIYCHWDGYLSNNGRILLENYSNSEKVSSLLLLGSLSSLDNEVSIPEGSLHSYDNKEEGITVAYHRDRGEDWCYTSYQDYEKISDIDSEFYHYLYLNGKWYVKEEVVEEKLDKVDKFIEIENEKWIELNSNLVYNSNSELV